MEKIILNIDGFKVDKDFYEQWTNDLRWLDELLNEGTHSEMLDKQERLRKLNPLNF